MYMHLTITFADVAKQVLDRCIVSNPETRDPKNIDFEVVLDYSFVEDHNDASARWLINFVKHPSEFLWCCIVVGLKNPKGQIDLSNTKICTESVTSHLRCFGRLAGANCPLLYTGTYQKAAAFAYRRNPRHRSRVPASAFSTVVVRILCDFFWHRHGAVRWMRLLCTQQFVVATKCLLTS